MAKPIWHAIAALFCAAELGGKHVRHGVRRAKDAHARAGLPILQIISQFISHILHGIGRGGGGAGGSATPHW